MKCLVVMLASIVASYVMAAPESPSLREQLSNPVVIAQGEYLARAGDCAFCHTETGGQLYAGGRVLPTPFGKMYTPNLSSDATTGIGDWDFNNFWQAMQYGKGLKGELLYPAFPFTSFTKITRADALAIFAYLQTVPAVHKENKKHELGFPYNIRSSLLAWRALYFQAGEYQADTSQSEEWNRGAYLVQGLGHCNECHTTRNSLGAMNEKQPLAGGVIPVQGWYAPNLSMQKGGGLEGWTQDDVVQLLKTGLSPKGSALGPMADVVRNSTQYLTAADLQAMAVYLATLPAYGEAVRAAAQSSNYAQGQTIYADNCVDCHGKEGQGAVGIYPALAGNTTVVEPTGVNAVRSILHGGFAPVTHTNPEPYSMPPFAGKFDNEDVSAVVNYIRQSWGNQATTISAAEVSTVRSLPIRY